MDLFDAEKRKHYLSFFTIVWSSGPIVAPFLGGYLEEYIGWKANFWFLAGYAIILLVAELFVGGETVPEKKPFNLPATSKLYGQMLVNGGFLLGVIVLALSYTVTMVFNIAGPFVVEQHFEFNSVVIGYCTLVLGVAWMVGGILAKKFTAVPFRKKIINAGWVQVVIIGILIALGWQFDDLVLLIAFAFAIHVCSGFLFTVFFTHNMLFFPKNAGIAGGLMGGLLYIITSLGSFMVSHSGEIMDTGDMALRYLMLSVPLFVAVIAMISYERRKALKDT